MNQLIHQANQYRTEHQRPGGIVLFYDGEVYAWKNELRDPQSERPGVIAIDADGNVFQATGGNDYDGAEQWYQLQ